MVHPRRQPDDSRRLVGRERPGHALYPDGSDDPDRAEDGTPLLDDDCLVLVNAWWEPLDFVPPATRAGTTWQTAIDTYDPARPAAAPLHAGDQLTVDPRSITVLRSPLPAGVPA